MQLRPLVGIAMTCAMAVAGCGAAPDDDENVDAAESGVSNATGTVFGTGSAGLNVRKSPSTSSAVVANLKNGAKVGIECQATGQTVSGNSVWNKTSAHDGYVSDAYVWTGHDGFIPGVPKCGGSQPPPPPDQPPSIPPGTQCEYDFFKKNFDAINGTGMASVRDDSFARIAQKVAAMKQKGSGVTLGGMLSLIHFEGASAVAWFNDLCNENVYGCWSAQGHYGYQFGLAPVHLSNYHPCASSWNTARRDYLLGRMQAAGFAPSASQIQSVAGELHAFCSASLQPTAVEYYILRAHDLGVPWNGKGNDLDSASTFPFFKPAIMIDSFFEVITHMGSGCDAPSNDNSLIGVCFGGGDGWYATGSAQQQILQSWKSYKAGHCP